MFGTRLNPTKPGAGHRSALERAGMACRELRAHREESGGGTLVSWDRVHTVFAKYGLFKIAIAPEYGGVATDPLLTVRVLERIGREGLSYVNLFLLQHAVASNTITRWATGEQKKRLLSTAVSGQTVLSVSEQSLGSIQPELNMHTGPRDERLVLTGSTRGSRSAATGGTLVVVAKHQHEESWTAVLIDTGQLGVNVRPNSGDADLLCDVEFTDCEVRDANVLGKRGDGLRILSAARSDIRLGVAAGCVGALEASLEITAAIASDRLRTSEWAQAPAAIEHFIAGVATDLEASRGLVYAAAELQADFDRRPTSEHLAAESSTLIREAYYFATQSIRRLQSCAESVRFANQTLFDSLPTRYRIGTEWGSFFVEPDQTLEHDIAAYYLVSERRDGPLRH